MYKIVLFLLIFLFNNEIDKKTLVFEEVGTNLALDSSNNEIVLYVFKDDKDSLFFVFSGGTTKIYENDSGFIPLEKNKKYFLHLIKLDYGSKISPMRFYERTLRDPDNDWYWYKEIRLIRNDSLIYPAYYSPNLNFFGEYIELK